MACCPPVFVVEADNAWSIGCDGADDNTLSSDELVNVGFFGDDGNFLADEIAADKDIGKGKDAGDDKHDRGAASEKSDDT